jgi:hypothetical protein
LVFTAQTNLFGGPPINRSIQRLNDEDQQLSEIPLAQRKLTPDTLDYYLANTEDRNTAICKAYQSGGYTLKQLGYYFTLHYSNVSGMVNHHKSKTPCVKAGGL